MLRFIAAGCLAGSAYILSNSPQTHVHIWGNGQYKPRPGFPQDIMNFENFSPKLIKDLSGPEAPSLTKIVFGPKAEAGLDVTGKLYLWNKHILNASKLEGVEDDTRSVKHLPCPEALTDCKFVDKILFALDSKGQVWQWRLDKSEAAEARKIPTLCNIKKIASGAGHFLALDSDGDLWSMGDDTYGQCGQQSFNRQPVAPFLQVKYPNPSKISLLPDKVLDVACGKFHSVALLESGEVWGWGRNHKNQLGDTDEKSGKAPTIASFVPTRVNGLQNKKVVKLAAGDMFSVFVVDELGDTEVFGCGLNSRGQLGLGFLTHITDMIKMQNISNFVYKDRKSFEIRPVGIRDLQCGAEHCLALMDVGVIYSWGANEYGEQGNRRRVIQDKPILLKAYKNKHVVSIAAGDRNSAVIWKD